MLLFLLFCWLKPFLHCSLNVSMSFEIPFSTYFPTCSIIARSDIVVVTYTLGKSLSPALGVTVLECTWVTSPSTGDRKSPRPPDELAATILNQYAVFCHLSGGLMCSRCFVPSWEVQKHDDQFACMCKESLRLFNIDELQLLLSSCMVKLFMNISDYYVLTFLIS